MAQRSGQPPLEVGSRVETGPQSAVNVCVRCPEQTEWERHANGTLIDIDTFCELQEMKRVTLTRF